MTWPILIEESVHDIIESYFDRLELTDEERGRERFRFGLALIAHAVELSEDLDAEREGAP